MSTTLTLTVCKFQHTWQPSKTPSPCVLVRKIRQFIFKSFSKCFSNSLPFSSERHRIFLLKRTFRTIRFIILPLWWVFFIQQGFITLETESANTLHSCVICFPLKNKELIFCTPTLQPFSLFFGLYFCKILPDIFSPALKLHLIAQTVLKSCLLRFKTAFCRVCHRTKSHFIYFRNFFYKSSLYHQCLGQFDPNKVFDMTH